MMDRFLRVNTAAGPRRKEMSSKNGKKGKGLRRGKKLESQTTLKKAADPVQYLNYQMSDVMVSSPQSKP